MSNELRIRVREGATRLRSEYSTKELAELFNRSPRTITRWTAQPREQYLAQAQEKRERVAELRQDGKTPKQISEEIGLPLPSVYGILRKIS